MGKYQRCNYLELCISKNYGTMYWLTGKDKYWHHIVSLSYQESDPLTMLTILTGKAVSIY